MSLPLGIGRHNARTQASLSLLTGWSVRDVQQAIEELRQAGEPICSGDLGVWIAESSEDLAESNRRLRSRLKSQYRTLRSQQNAERRMRAAEQHVTEPTIWSAA